MNTHANDENEIRFPVFCKIYGVSDPDFQGALAQTAADDHLQIVATDEAVFVYNIPIHRLLGRVSDELARKLKARFGKDLCLDAIVEKRTGGNGGLFGCNIRIFETSNMMKSARDNPLPPLPQ